jgi:hypothetical protein
MVSRIVHGTCTECGESCVGKIADFGIGPYEYWGQQCVDTQLCLVSQCCEAEMRDGAGDLMVMEDYQDDEV